MIFPIWRTGDKNFPAIQNNGQPDRLIRILQEVNADGGEAYVPEEPYNDGSLILKRLQDDDYLLLAVRKTDWVVRTAPGQFMVMLDDDFRTVFTIGGNW